MVLLGVTHDDTPEIARPAGGEDLEAAHPARREVLRGRAAPLLVISQFTLYADTRKGRRPSWSAAAPGAVSEPLYDAFCAALECSGARSNRSVRRPHGRRLVNDGPVTLILDS